MTLFGEELGELGSRYYCQHPVFPLAKTVADINLEQLGTSALRAVLDALHGTSCRSRRASGVKYFTGVHARMLGSCDSTRMRRDEAHPFPAALSHFAYGFVDCFGWRHDAFAWHVADWGGRSAPPDAAVG